MSAEEQESFALLCMLPCHTKMQSGWGGASLVVRDVCRKAILRAHMMEVET